MRQTIFFVIFLTSVGVYSQQSKIDSLTVLFNEAKVDTLKAEILAKIGIAAYYVDFKKARFYNDSLIQFQKAEVKSTRL
jgi:dihydroorotase